jgi:transcriptional regulator with XRE-family HTH domain
MVSSRANDVYRSVYAFPHARKLAAMNALLAHAVSRTGSPSRADDLLRYSFHVSKDDRSFAQVLADVIAKNYGSDSDFATAAGISNSAVSRYKTGVQVPRPETIDKMAPAMRMSVPRLMAIAYPKTVNPDAVLDGATIHPLVLQLNALLTDGVMPDDDRRNLEQVVGSVLAQYKKHLRGRKAV